MGACRGILWSDLAGGGLGPVLRLNSPIFGGFSREKAGSDTLFSLRLPRDFVEANSAGFWCKMPGYICALESDGFAYSEHNQGDVYLAKLGYFRLRKTIMGIQAFNLPKFSRLRRSNPALVYKYVLPRRAFRISSTTLVNFYVNMWPADKLFCEAREMLRNKNSLTS